MNCSLEACSVQVLDTHCIDVHLNDLVTAWLTMPEATSSEVFTSHDQYKAAKDCPTSNPHVIGLSTPNTEMAEGSLYSKLPQHYSAHLLNLITSANSAVNS